MESAPNFGPHNWCTTHQIKFGNFSLKSKAGKSPSLYFGAESFNKSFDDPSCRASSWSTCLMVFIEKGENEIGIKRAVNRFLWDCCDRPKHWKPFMTSTETAKCDCQNPTPVQNTFQSRIYFCQKIVLSKLFLKIVFKISSETPF